MYRIDTGSARTDLYGIGKGAAQVLDISPLREVAAQEANRNFAAQQAKDRKAAQREAEVQDQIAKMASVKIMPKDQELIAGKLQGVRDYVVKNNGMRDASPAQMMEFQKLIGDAKIAADQSQNFREAWEQRGLEVMKNQDKYRPEAIEQHWKMALPETAGQWNIDDSQYKQNFDYFNHVTKDLVPLAKQRADATQTPYREIFTEADAKKAIYDDLYSDPVKLEQAVYDFNKAEDKMGAKTPEEYYQNKYAKYLVQNQRKAGPQSDGAGTKTKAPSVSGTYKNKGGGKREFQFEYIDKVDNPYISIPNPKGQSKYIKEGGKDVPNPMYGESVEVKPYKVVWEGGKTVLKALTKPKEGEKGEEITLDYNSVSDIMNNKFGIENVFALENEETTPSNVKVKRADTSTKKVNEVKRKTKDGKIAIFDADTKEFIRYE